METYPSEISDVALRRYQHLHNLDKAISRRRRLAERAKTQHERTLHQDKLQRQIEQMNKLCAK